MAGGSNWALVSVLLVTIWKCAGWTMIFYLVAIRNVPKDLMEAASWMERAGGASSVNVTLPLISPTTFFLFIVQMIQALQAYDQINVLTQGGPAGSTRTIIVSVLSVSLHIVPDRTSFSRCHYTYCWLRAALVISGLRSRRPFTIPKQAERGRKYENLCEVSAVRSPLYLAVLAF